ncbi:MAG: hypothetical protein L6R39_006752 [Caloplaca ligustica]|nr:MAG: hypothetical protein L6R39_006752 [Caloplaca ligustica]
MECLASLARGMVYAYSNAFLLSSLGDSGPLGYAVIVALPHNVGIGREGEDALDRFAAMIHDDQRLPRTSRKQ